jgi:hypothetical protein
MEAAMQSPEPADLFRLRLKATFNENETIGIDWGKAVAHGLMAFKALEQLGWSEGEVAQAKQELCRTLTFLECSGRAP